MATAVEQMALDAWKSTEIPNSSLQGVFIYGYKSGFDVGVKFGHDTVAPKVEELEHKVRVMWELLNNNKIQVPFKPEGG